MDAAVVVLDGDPNGARCPRMVRRLIEFDYAEPSDAEIGEVRHLD